MSLHPPVNVLIPAFNAEYTIASSVESIQKQTFTDIRIIVVDDGSTDRTGSILRDLQLRDPRIHVISRANGGIVDALNDGLANCSAEFLARHDADDLAFPERIEKQLKFMRANPAYVGVDCRYWHIDGNGVRTFLPTSKAGEVQSNPFSLPSQEPYLMHPFAMLRCEAVKSVGGYRYAFHSEDTDLYWRLLSFGRMYHLSDVLGEYRVHVGSITGASVLNGRISAANSQLAAISHNRRTAGVSDIEFPRERLARFKEAGSLQGILSLTAEMLTREEAAYHAAATSAKLLELGIYRPYLLDPEDIATIAKSLDQFKEYIKPTDLPYIGRLKASMSLKLAQNQRFGDIARLKPGLAASIRLLSIKVGRKMGSIIARKVG